MASAAAAVLASEPHIVEVLQPMDIEDAIWLSKVSYMGSIGWRNPGCAVALTCSPSIVTTDTGPKNLNVASLAGFTVKVRAPDSTRNKYLYGDTLRVRLIVTSLDTVKTLTWRHDQLIRSTIECILVNAAKPSQFDPNISPQKVARFVDLKVVGRPYAKHYSGVFSTAPFTAGPRHRYF